MLIRKTAPKFGRMLMLACLTAIGMPNVAWAGVTCNTSGDLRETVETLLGYQQGAEVWDDVNVALGIIPSAAIGENVREFTGSTAEKLLELQKLCSTIVSKDPVEQYFYVIDKLFSSTAMAPWVSMNVEVGKAILANANNIVSNTVERAIGADNFTSLDFKISLSQYRRFGWNKEISGKELKAGNFLRLARVIVRNKKNRNDVRFAPINPSFESASPVHIYLTSGGFIDGHGNPSEVNLFFDLLWKNGQRSIVPVASNYYKVSQHQVIFPFVLKNDNFVLDR